ncbi:hypothetical protein DFQ27_002363 [Actinomortierella ambigua]|uniref:DUF202 domain-containing protein n=1 Tax=Actinomortierella ambigua TaxID=1343610 RepID=A0A9P6QC40_9FUNG|nr:hypothetical protein DFQ26_002933 [Actinomortierella ambigua]KAG0262381.1 hypothetical protein DFQ27_002363 [Actinomortierella ambigua]
MFHPFKHKQHLYRGHRTKSLDVTEDELVEIRGESRERTFDGAYWRTALKSFTTGMLILRLFTKAFYKIGMVFVALGMALLAIAALRRRAAGDVFDETKPFETSGFWVLITTIVVSFAYILLLVLLLTI